MKNTLKTAALCVGSIGLLAGSASAQTSPVVGFETLNYGVGFTALGLRLHENPVASGDLENVTATAVTDSDVADFGTVLTAGTTYILEIENGTGIIQEIVSWTGSDLTTPSDLTADVSIGDSYSLRPSATLQSIFGDGVGLTQGQGTSAGTDQIWVPDGAGSYNKYYYDLFAPPNFDTASWAILDNSPDGSSAIDGTATNLIYADGIVMNAVAAGSVVVSGDLKTAETELNLLAGFNFVSSVYPVGATLQSTFGDGVGLTQGQGTSAGTDQIWVPDGAGGYNKYYYDLFAPPNFDTASWAILDNSPDGSSAVDGTTVDLTSGIVVSSVSGGNLVENPPSYYAGL